MLDYKQYLSKQFLIFLIVGGSSTLLQFVLLVAMVEWLSADKVLASSSSYVLSAFYNYLLNYRITFDSRQSHWRTAPKFVLVVLIGVAVNTAIFAIFLLVLPYLAAQFLATAGAMMTNYCLHKFWIYRGI